MPAASADSSVCPTAATCGSVNTTRGERAPSLRGSIRASRPVTTSAAIRPWYDPARDERVVDQPRRERLLAAEQARQRLDDRHARAETRPRLPQLGADDAAAEHEQPLRDGTGGRRLPIRPRRGLREPRDRRDGG